MGASPSWVHDRSFPPVGVKHSVTARQSPLCRNTYFMSQRNLTFSRGQRKNSSKTHDDTNKKRKKSKVSTTLDGSSERRSWIHCRAVELVKEAYPDCNSFNDDFWIKCYAMAKKEWDDGQ